jgi:hypothetical protein
MHYRPSPEIVGDILGLACGYPVETPARDPLTKKDRMREHPVPI